MIGGIYLMVCQKFCFLTLEHCSSGNLSQRFVYQFFCGSWPWPHPFTSNHSIVGTFQPVNAPSKTVCTAQIEPPLKVEEWFLWLFVLKGGETTQPLLTRAFPTCQDSCHVHGMLRLCLPTSPTPPFLLASTKLIFQNGLRHLITCDQSCMACTRVTGI